jgi:HD-like signal output (HDOD) protein/ActR/RegA family two-component response regulator
MKRILIVDDEQNVLDGMRLMLEGQRGRWELHFAPSGESALDACATLPFDVVLADVRMPGLDGISLLQIMRDRYPECARVLLSAQADLTLAARAASLAYRVLVKPPYQKDLVTNLERVFILQDSFTTPELRGIIGQIGGLPSLSRTYTALAVAVRDPESSIAQVAAIIEQDVAMSAKVLQIVNSGFFGLPQAINSVGTAVSYLGMETIKNLALATETFTLFVPDPCIPRDFLETMHLRAERAALIAGALPLSSRDRDVSIVGALLHDMGELVLASRMPREFNAALALAKERGCPGYEAEEEMFGVSHAEVGAYLLGVWGISGLIVEAVAHHHRPQRVPHFGFDSSAAVYMAALIADELETRPTDLTGAEMRESDKKSLEALRLVERYPVFRARAVKALQMA